MLILCDFDNTITTEDVTNLLWDEFGLPNWRERLLPKYRAGQATTLELMDEGWRSIGLAERELLAVATSRIGLRDGFLDFVDQCARRDWPFHVISCGIDWYLRAFLPPSVTFTSYTGVRDEGWRVRLPAGFLLPAGADFKIHVMRQMQAAHPDHEAVFIGDGRNDYPIARECDRVFALRGSTLATLCREGGVDAQEFESFREIDAVLAGAMTRRG